MAVVRSVPADTVPSKGLLPKEYRQARRNLVLVAAIFLGQQFARVTLDNFRQLTINNPLAVAYALAVLTLYLLYRLNFEWRTAGPDEKASALARLDYQGTAWFASVSVQAFCVHEILTAVRLHDQHPKYRIAAWYIILAFVVLVFGLVLRHYLRKSHLRDLSIRNQSELISKSVSADTLEDKGWLTTIMVFLSIVLPVALAVFFELNAPESASLQPREPMWLHTLVVSLLSLVGFSQMPLLGKSQKLKK